MTHHYMRINQGQICFIFANSPNVLHEFNSDREAAEALVHAMMTTNVTSIMLSSSVDFPEEYGLPEFHYSVFSSKVQQVLERLHQLGSR